MRPYGLRSAMKQCRMSVVAVLRNNTKLKSAGLVASLTAAFEETGITPTPPSAATMARREWIVKDVQLVHKYGATVRVDVTVSNGGGYY